MKNVKMKKYRKMLTEWDAPYIQALAELIPTQSKVTLCHWCLDYAEVHILSIYKKAYPDDGRLEKTLQAARDWLSGKVKLPFVKQIILNEAHAAAREAEGKPAAQAAARAVGQCASTIHSARHCIGLALYGALAVAYDELGNDALWEQLEARAGEECQRMLTALQARAVEGEPNPSNVTWVC